MPDNIPKVPLTQEEIYLAIANGQEYDLPTPKTRSEKYLYEIAKSAQGIDPSKLQDKIVELRNQNITKGMEYIYPDEGYPALGRVELDYSIFGWAFGYIPVYGTLSNPFSEVANTGKGMPFYDAFIKILGFYGDKKFLLMHIDAGEIGSAEAHLWATNHAEEDTPDITAQFGYCDAEQSVAATVVWKQDDNSESGLRLESAFFEQNGTITDLTEYADVIQVVTYFPRDLNEYEE